MKKMIVVISLLLCLCISVHAKNEEPKYKIISNSYQQEDIQYMYKIKTELLKNYKEWVKGVDNKDQVLADHQYVYNANYKQGVYEIIIGKGKGKTLTGDLKVNYCESTQDIETKSLLMDWLF